MNIWYGKDEINSRLVGKVIREIWIDQERVSFVTDAGVVNLRAAGDCCSHTIIHDILGVKKILGTGEVVSFGDTSASEYCEAYTHEWDDCIENYGLEIVVDHPVFGEVTSVISYRNSSNGYYGGYLEYAHSESIIASRQIFDDVLEVEWT